MGRYKNFGGIKSGTLDINNSILGDYTLLLNRLLLIISPAAERKGAKVGIMADLKAVVDCAAVETA